MPVNPSLQRDPLSSPIERANSLNDPAYVNQEGYYPYDLTHSEFITPRFGEINPCMHLDTVPADRHTVHDNTKTVINQINGNLLSTVNQYIDSFYIPLRACFPNNYEKLIPNPTKGDDLPNSALPMVPLHRYIRELLFSSFNFRVSRDLSISVSQYVESVADSSNQLDAETSFGLNRLIFASYILSRGQLLDYLGIQYESNVKSDIVSPLQRIIDKFFTDLWTWVYNHNTELYVYGVRLDPTSNELDVTDVTNDVRIDSLSHFRQGISDTFERGSVLWFDPKPNHTLTLDFLGDSAAVLLGALGDIIDVDDYSIAEVDTMTTEAFRTINVNIAKVLAYQLSVAQYFTNDAVDNIFTSELYMQNLRASMYPTREGSITSTEPVFTYNGVSTEYDYISYGGFYYSLLSSDNATGIVARQQVVGSLLFLMRRSLRFGDKFATTRPRMLAVGQLEINVTDGAVSPIDVTINLLAQRYLNAANHIGSGFLPYYASMFGVVPSDTGVIPRFLAHRKIVLQSQITNNTAENQGYQTTNLVGYSDNNAFDVFIDDFGFIISVMSFDVLPVYTSGIDDCYYFFDRFDYFNPMMQNIGDQPLFVSELSGNPNDLTRIFGYLMRNSEYKYKVSRAHGAFVNDLPGFLMKYPTWEFVDPNDQNNLRISPEFIRDKAMYLDQLIPQTTGYSPAQYYHFAVACVNQVHSARKIQRTPSVLF